MGRSVQKLGKRGRRVLSAGFGTVAALVLAAGVVRADEGCITTCRDAFGTLRYTKGVLMVLDSCWVKDGATYCVYREWQ